MKKIKGIPYYYLQYRDGNKVISKEIGKVYPGAAAEEESKAVKRNDLLRKREDLQSSIRILKDGIEIIIPVNPGIVDLQNILQAVHSL